MQHRLLNRRADWGSNVTPDSDWGRRPSWNVRVENHPGSVTAVDDGINSNLVVS